MATLTRSADAAGPAAVARVLRAALTRVPLASRAVAKQLPLSLTLAALMGRVGK